MTTVGKRNILKSSLLVVIWRGSDHLVLGGMYFCPSGNCFYLPNVHKVQVIYFDKCLSFFITNIG